jgi:hypothetical protein
VCVCVCMDEHACIWYVCMHMCVSMYVYVCVYASAHIYAYFCVCTFERSISVSKHTRCYSCMCACIYVAKQAYEEASVCMYACMYVFVYKASFYAAHETVRCYVRMFACWHIASSVLHE